MTNTFKATITIAAILLMASTSTLAETVDPLCSVVTDSMLAAYQLTGVELKAHKESKAQPGGASFVVTECRWTSKDTSRGFELVNMATPGLVGNKPVSCVTRQISGKSLTTCSAGVNASMIMVSLMQTGDTSDPKALATLRAHSEEIVKNLGKLAK
jgi:hypothetical protein